jgi:hypothetical protein
MADHFIDLWRRLKQRCPSLPVPECQKIIRDRYRQILDHTTWSFQYGRGQFITNKEIAGTCTVVHNSPNVSATSAALPGDSTTIVGRQIIFNGQQPIYSIIDNTDASSLVMDQAYGGASGSSVSFEISNIYFTPESRCSDFERLIAIVDPPNNWQLPFNVHIEELNDIDPQRSSVGTPWMFADMGWNNQYLSQLGTGIVDQFGYSSTSDALPQKEMWPRPISDYVYPYVYLRRITDLSDPNSKPLGFIRGDVILEGALADAAGYPGTVEVPNPMANPVYMNMHTKKYENMLHDMIIRDRSVMERDLSVARSYLSLPYPPMWYPYSARFRQNHVLPAY